MTTDRLQRLLIWLLVASATIFLLDRVFTVVSALASPLLLFALAWLFVLALKPLVDGLTRLELPIPLLIYQPAERRTRRVVQLVRLPAIAAILLVYTGMLAVIVGFFVLIVPVIVPQVAGLQESLPQAANAILLFIDSLQRYVNRLGLRVDLTSIFRPEAISAQLGAVGSEVVKQSLTIAGSIASLLFNLVFVLIVSFYMMLDGARLVERGIRLLPPSWHEEVHAFLALVDRTFGGFLRSQLLQALLYGVATAILMVGLGLPDVALASVIAGLCVLVPLIGGPLAMIPPLVLAIVAAPNQVVWLLIGLLVIQQVLFNVVMPKLVGQIVGLPPLLVFAALLIGGSVAGGWGILFGIPLAGVLASVIQFLSDRASLRRAAAPEVPAAKYAEPAPVQAKPPHEPDRAPSGIPRKS